MDDCGQGLHRGKWWGGFEVPEGTGTALTGGSARCTDVGGPGSPVEWQRVDALAVARSDTTTSLADRVWTSRPLPEGGLRRGPERFGFRRTGPKLTLQVRPRLAPTVPW